MGDGRGKSSNRGMDGSQTSQYVAAMIVPTVCPECHKREDITVDAEGYFKWQQGLLIQLALPELTSVQREQLITGFCGPCWDAMFADDEDDGGYNSPCPPWEQPHHGE